MMRADLASTPRFTAVRYFLGRYKLIFAGISGLTIISAVVDSFSVVAFFPVFSSLLGSAQEGEGGILGWVSRVAEYLPFSNPIVAASVLLVFVFLAKTLFTLLHQVLVAMAAAKVHYEVKKQILDRYAGAHYQFMLDNQQGTLLYNCLNAPNSVPGVLQTGSNMATSLLKAITISIVLVAILPYAALALLGVALAYYAGMHYLSRRVSFQLGLRATRASSEQTVVANEFLSGFHQIITLNVARWWTGRFDRENRTLRDVEATTAAWYAVPRPVMELSAVLLMLGLIAAVWFSSADGIADRLPKVGVFAVALAQLMPPLTTLGTLRMKLMGMLPNLDLVYNVLTGPVPARHDGRRTLESFEKGILFDNVSFTHKGRAPLFDALTVTFDKGAVTAIVGSSGAGKTTIANLILGLFEPTGGQIIVDGVPLEEISHESWLSKIGFVSQEPFTYHASVADNLRLGRVGHSEESVVEAAKIANAHEFISQLPRGYDTIVGERGMKLSGGQQQRLAIARALLDSPEILIFDEATSNLDSVSEKLVQEAIKNVSTNRTVIIIAHRLSTVSHADKIVVFEKGRVVEEGNHQELLSKRGHYARLAGAIG